MKKYLESTKYIDWDTPAIKSQASSLASTSGELNKTIKNCFEFVRDEIKHSSDYKLDPVTCAASEVLEHKTGFCYAKSHLLAALLRANNIASGLCYQRLVLDSDNEYCLHGLNAVYLEDLGWYRIDPRGNKSGVNAQFCPPSEVLAFSTLGSGETDLPEVWSEPLKVVTTALEQFDSYIEVNENLPDIEIITVHSG